jgi:hypothetical protein
MIKRGTPQFTKSGGWEFVFYPRSGDSRRTQEACAGCHRAAASTDYVFGNCDLARATFRLTHLSRGSDLIKYCTSCSREQVNPAGV